MYEADEYGKYQSLEKWLDVWPGGGPYVAGWCAMEVRRYTDGMVRISRGPAQYTDKASPGVAVLHEVYLMTARALRSATPHSPAHQESPVDRAR